MVLPLSPIKKLVFILITSALFWLSMQWVQPVYASPKQEASLLVHFAPDVGEAERNQVIARMGASLDRWYAPIFTARVQMTMRQSMHQSALQEIAKHHPEIESVELDGQIRGVPILEAQVPFGPSSGNSTIPSSPMLVNDPDFANPQRVYAPQRIEAPMAWAYSLGSPEITVAVIDSGIDGTHPELRDRVVAGYDFTNDDADPTDDHGHGTHVAGIVAMTANNGVGSAGICPRCSLMPVKVLDANNAGRWSDVAAGIIFAADQGAHIINMSLGGASDSRIVREAVDYATDKGSLVIAAAGNGRTDEPFYPAAYDNVISVSATRNDDSRWSLSNFGSHIDVAAPGYAIFSTHNDQNNYYHGYLFMSGTSMASPHVAGLAGLLWAQDPSRSAEEIRSLILENVDDLGEPGWDVHYGHGRINAHRSLAKTPPQSLAGGTLSGAIWLDENGNGRWERSEQAGATSVIVHIYDSEEKLVSEVLPDADGRWEIVGLYPGFYAVTAHGSEDILITSEIRYELQLDAGEQVSDLNFATRPAVSSPEFQYSAFIPLVVATAPTR